MFSDFSLFGESRLIGRNVNRPNADSVPRMPPNEGQRNERGEQRERREQPSDRMRRILDQSKQNRERAAQLREKMQAKRAEFEGQSLGRVGTRERANRTEARTALTRFIQHFEGEYQKLEGNLNFIHYQDSEGRLLADFETQFPLHEANLRAMDELLRTYEQEVGIASPDGIPLDRQTSPITLPEVDRIKPPVERLYPYGWRDGRGQRGGHEHLILSFSTGWGREQKVLPNVSGNQGAMNLGLRQSIMINNIRGQRPLGQEGTEQGFGAWKPEAEQMDYHTRALEEMGIHVEQTPNGTFVRITYIPENEYIVIEGEKIWGPIGTKPEPARKSVEQRSDSEQPKERPASEQRPPERERSQGVLQRIAEIAGRNTGARQACERLRSDITGGNFRWGNRDLRAADELIRSLARSEGVDDRDMNRVAPRNAQQLLRFIDMVLAGQDSSSTLVAEATPPESPSQPKKTPAKPKAAPVPSPTRPQTRPARKATPAPAPRSPTAPAEPAKKAPPAKKEKPASSIPPPAPDKLADSPAVPSPAPGQRSAEPEPERSATPQAPRAGAPESQEKPGEKPKDRVEAYLRTLALPAGFTLGPATRSNTSNVLYDIWPILKDGKQLNKKEVELSEGKISLSNGPFDPSAYEGPFPFPSDAEKTKFAETWKTFVRPEEAPAPGIVPQSAPQASREKGMAAPPPAAEKKVETINGKKFSDLITWETTEEGQGADAFWKKKLNEQATPALLKVLDSLDYASRRVHVKGRLTQSAASLQFEVDGREVHTPNIGTESQGVWAQSAASRFEEIRKEAPKPREAPAPKPASPAGPTAQPSAPSLAPQPVPAEAVAAKPAPTEVASKPAAAPKENIETAVYRGVEQGVATLRKSIAGEAGAPKVEDALKALNDLVSANVAKAVKLTDEQTPGGLNSINLGLAGDSKTQATSFYRGNIEKQIRDMVTAQPLKDAAGKTHKLIFQNGTMLLQPEGGVPPAAEIANAAPPQATDILTLNPDQLLSFDEIEKAVKESAVFKQAKNKALVQSQTLADPTYHYLSVAGRGGAVAVLEQTKSGKWVLRWSNEDAAKWKEPVAFSKDIQREGNADLILLLQALGIDNVGK